MTTPVEVPDFQRLGSESPFSATEWRAAWITLDEPRLWPTLLALSYSSHMSLSAIAAELHAARILEEQ